MAQWNRIFYAQSSNFKPCTLENSLVLFVTKVKFKDFA